MKVQHVELYRDFSNLRTKNFTISVLLFLSCEKFLHYLFPDSGYFWLYFLFVITSFLDLNKRKKTKNSKVLKILKIPLSFLHRQSKASTYHMAKRADEHKTSRRTVEEEKKTSKLLLRSLIPSWMMNGQI